MAQHHDYYNFVQPIADTVLMKWEADQVMLNLAALREFSCT